jgi:hypothetical protein
MIVNKYGNYVRKCMWQPCGSDRVDICMTFHRRAFDFFVPLHANLPIFKIARLRTVKEMSTLSYPHSCHTTILSHSIDTLHGKSIIALQSIGYFTSDNEPGAIENATHNTSGGKAGYLSPPCPGLRSNVLWVAFSIPPGSLSLVKYPVYLWEPIVQ